MEDDQIISECIKAYEEAIEFLPLSEYLIYLENKHLNFGVCHFINSGLRISTNDHSDIERFIWSKCRPGSDFWWFYPNQGRGRIATIESLKTRLKILKTWTPTK